MPYANNQGVKIYYEVEGQGPPLVLAHGAGVSLEMWRNRGYVKEPSKDYQTILFDARGHGKSDKPITPESYQQEVFCSDVTAVMDALGVKKAHYFGYSMGTMMGFRLAQYALPRFHSMILGGMDAYVVEAEKQGNEQRLEVLKVAVERGIEYYVEWLEKVFGPAPMIRAQCLSNDPKVLFALMSALHSWPSAEDILPQMNIPCLVFAGSADPRCVSAMGSAKKMPNATFMPFPGLNHVQCSERSDLVLPHIKKFLAEVSKNLPGERN